MVAAQSAPDASGGGLGDHGVRNRDYFSGDDLGVGMMDIIFIAAGLILLFGMFVLGLNYQIGRLDQVYYFLKHNQKEIGKDFRKYIGD